MKKSWADEAEEADGPPPGFDVKEVTDKLAQSAKVRGGAGHPVWRDGRLASKPTAPGGHGGCTVQAVRPWPGFWGGQD